MKQVLWKHKIEIAIFSLLLAFVLTVSFVKVDYNFTAPGYNDEVSNFITIENAYDHDGSFHTTSVIVGREISILQKFFADREGTVNVYEIPNYYSYVDDLSDITVMGQQSKDDSLNNSLVVGLTNAGYTVDYTVNDVVYLTYNFLDEDTLKIGDIVVSVNGGDNETEMDNTACDETATFLIIRDGEEMTFDVTRNTYEDEKCSFGAYIDPLTQVLSAELDFEFHNDFTTGPSGGLMQSLYIYNIVTPNDITGGLKVAGTGTIDEFGNVGSIGGIEQKIITSALNGIDIFFVPHLSDAETDNYIKAKAVLETLDTNMRLVPVDNFSDAVNYLESRYGGAFDDE